MSSDVRIRRFTAREWPAYRALRLRSLADAPNAFGSSLALEESWAHELWMARLMAAEVSGRDCPLVAESTAADGAMLGLLWAKCDADDAGIVNLFQMWVAPEARGRGAASALVDEALAWARSIGARLVQLGVVVDNQDAIRLYERKGFRNAGVPAPIRPGSALLEQAMQLAL
ncbi:GNAT family N-acetyltransferase [Massilia norwichensis]|uniref:GNAT family N-acetyltransferase n=1 Tax=Massilia norwichensis TaxID=1442366 RepID=A0ABT2AAH6_9BURK|nr:GNAT family N-acetyltransferase [Massilia norwichensis]